MTKKKVVFSLRGVSSEKEHIDSDQEARSVNFQLRNLFKEYSLAQTSKEQRSQLKILNKIVSIYLQYDHLDLDSLPEFSRRAESCHERYIACVEKYLQIANMLGDEFHKTKALEALSMLCLKEKQFGEALGYASDFLETVQRSSNKLLLAQAYKLMGDCYLLKGEETQFDQDFRNSEKNFRHAHEIIVNLTDCPSDLQSETLINLGILGTKSNDFESAYNFLNLAFSVAAKEAYQNKNPTNLIRTLTNLSFLFKKQENFKQAILFIKQELEISQRFKMTESIQECYWDLIDACVKNDDIECLPAILHELKDYLRSQNKLGSLPQSEFKESVEMVEEWQDTLSKIFRLEKQAQDADTKTSGSCMSQLKLAGYYAAIGSIHLALKIYIDIFENFPVETFSADFVVQIGEDLDSFLEEINKDKIDNLLRIHKDPLNELKSAIQTHGFDGADFKRIFGLIKAAVRTIDNNNPLLESESPYELVPAALTHQIPSRKQYTQSFDHTIKVIIPCLSGSKELSILCPAILERSADFYWLKEQATSQFQKVYKASPTISSFYNHNKLWCLEDLLYMQFSSEHLTKGSIWGEVTAQVEKFSGYLLPDFKNAYLEKTEELKIKPNVEIIKLFNSNNTLVSQLKLQGASIDTEALLPLLPLLNPKFYDCVIVELNLSMSMVDNTTLLSLSKMENFLSRLEILVLSNTRITSAAISTLLQYFNKTSSHVEPSLIFLDLSYNRLNDICLADLVSVAKICQSLNHLKLDGNDFDFFSPVVSGSSSSNEPFDDLIRYCSLDLSISELRLDSTTQANLLDWLLLFNPNHPITRLDISRSVVSGEPSHYQSSQSMVANKSNLIHLCLRRISSLKTLLASNCAFLGLETSWDLLSLLELEGLDLSYYSGEVKVLLENVLPRCPNLKKLRLIGSIEDAAMDRVVQPFLHSLATPVLK